MLKKRLIAMTSQNLQRFQRWRNVKPIFIGEYGSTYTSDMVNGLYKCRLEYNNHFTPQNHAKGVRSPLLLMKLIDNFQNLHFYLKNEIDYS